MNIIPGMEKKGGLIFVVILLIITTACSPFLLEYNNPVDPKADNYNGYKTVASAAEVTADWPEEGAEITWCVFRSSVVVDGGADRYALQIAESADSFESPYYEILDSQSNVLNASEADLYQGSWYYRVRARQADGDWGTWSQAVGFIAVSGVDADGVSPASGVYTTDTTPLLDWPDITEAVSYQVEFATSEAGLDVSGAVSVDSSGYQIPDTDTFTLGETCYWRVRGVNEDGVAGVWSQVFEVDIIKIEIGSIIEGGIVFYIHGSGGGLVCAESDQSTNIEWGGYGKTAGTSTAVGAGQANTMAIVSKLGSGWLSGDYAAKLCNKLELNGYSDWFLPSKDELNLMYENLHLQGLGGFGNLYWSSSEDGSDDAWRQRFDSGEQDTNRKDNHNDGVRAVRAFSY